jgi:hypothetical protein
VALEDAPEPVCEDVLDVVEVELICAALSAEVSFGGLISGVLCGAESDAPLLPPQALSVTAQSTSTSTPLTARNAVT